MTPPPEVEVTLLLSQARLTEAAADRLRALLRTHMDWYRVLGLLAAHRTAGVAWANILDHAIEERRDLAPTYFLKGLEILYKGQELSAQEQLKHTAALQWALDDADVPSVLLKGAAVSGMAYKRMGMRQFKDNDLLIRPDDLAAAGAVLDDLGYEQGSWDYATATVRAAPRKDRLFYSLTSHQTHPYMKPTPADHFSECHRVDVHLSLDLMTGNRTDGLVRELIDRRERLLDLPIWTVSRVDMAIFCCVHFYKEAIHEGEVLQLKDLVLYKLTDLDALLDDDTTAALPERTARLDLTEAVYFALHYLNALYPDRIPGPVLSGMRPDSTDYLDEVRARDGSLIRWGSTILDRFFDAGRTAITRPAERTLR